MNKHDYDPIHQQLSHPAHHLWLLFNYIKDKDDNTFWYNIETLMELTAYSNRCIITAIRELERHHVISCERKHRKTTTYTLLKPFKFKYDEEILSEPRSPNVNENYSCVNDVHAMSEPESPKIDVSVNHVHPKSEPPSLHPISILNNDLSKKISSQDVVSQISEEYRKAEEYLHAILIEINPKLRIAIRLQFDRIYKKLDDKEKEDLQILYDKATELIENPEIVKEAQTLIR